MSRQAAWNKRRHRLRGNSLVSDPNALIGEGAALSPTVHTSRHGFLTRTDRAHPSTHRTATDSIRHPPPQSILIGRGRALNLRLSGSFQKYPHVFLSRS